MHTKADGPASASHLSYGVRRRLLRIVRATIRPFEAVRYVSESPRLEPRDTHRGLCRPWPYSATDHGACTKTYYRGCLRANYRLRLPGASTKKVRDYDGNRVAYRVGPGPSVHPPGMCPVQLMLVLRSRILGSNSLCPYSTVDIRAMRSSSSA